MKKITGIRSLCSATKNLSPVGYAPRYKIQVHLDVSTGELIFTDIVGNGCIMYDNHTYYMFNISHPATISEIKAMLVSARGVKFLESYGLEV